LLVVVGGRSGLTTRTLVYAVATVALLALGIAVT
jgi:hypothetical protein